MKTTVICPHCQVKIKCDDRLLGQFVTCPNPQCKLPFTAMPAQEVIPASDIDVVLIRPLNKWYWLAPLLGLAGLLLVGVALTVVVRVSGKLVSQASPGHPETQPAPVPTKLYAAGPLWSELCNNMGNSMSFVDDFVGKRIAVQGQVRELHLPYCLGLHNMGHDGVGYSCRFRKPIGPVSGEIIVEGVVTGIHGAWPRVEMDQCRLIKP